MGKNVASLENLVSDVKSEVFDRIYTETTERTSAADGIIKKLSEIEASLECNIAEIDEKWSKAEAELCNQFRSQCKLLGDQISQRHEEAVKISNDHFAKLKASKIDRSELGSILVEIGMRFDAEKYGLPLHPEETQLVPKMDGPVNPGGPSLSSGVTGAAKSR